MSNACYPCAVWQQLGRLATTKVNAEFVDVLMQGNNSVEAVVCLLSMQTLPDLARFVSETHRVLKPGSPFIFVQSGLPHCTHAGSAVAPWAAMSCMQSMLDFELVPCHSHCACELLAARMQLMPVKHASRCCQKRALRCSWPTASDHTACDCVTDVISACV